MIGVIRSWWRMPALPMPHSAAPSGAGAGLAYVAWGPRVGPGRACGCGSSSCLGCPAPAVVYAVAGERRIVPYQIKNDTRSPLSVTLAPQDWRVCGCTESAYSFGPRVQPEKLEIPPCGSAHFDIVLDTARMEACRCYCAEIQVEGACFEPIETALCVLGRTPAVRHHAYSRLASWVRQCCFGDTGAYVAPPPLVGGCRKTCD